MCAFSALESYEEVQLDRDKREDSSGFKTRLFGDVEVVVKDPNPDDLDKFPLTLPPRVVRDGFAVKRDQVGSRIFFLHYFILSGKRSFEKFQAGYSNVVS